MLPHKSVAVHVLINSPPSQANPKFESSSVNTASILSVQLSTAVTFNVLTAGIKSIQLTSVLAGTPLNTGSSLSPPIYSMKIDSAKLPQVSCIVYSNADNHLQSSFPFSVANVLVTITSPQLSENNNATSASVGPNGLLSKHKLRPVSPVGITAPLFNCGACVSPPL